MNHSQNGAEDFDSHAGKVSRVREGEHPTGAKVLMGCSTGM